MQPEHRRAEYYRARASEMRQAAENAETAEIRATFLRLEADWLKLATAADAAPGEDVRGQDGGG